jgi:GH3 auxin-responsive promoter
MIAEWINRAWMLACRRECQRFEQAIQRVDQTQLGLWQSLITSNRRSVYGLKHGFDRLRSVDDYRQRVPIVRYETLLGEIEEIANGEPNVLSCESVDRLVPTGGSSGGAKLVPYTASLKKEFQRAIAAWIGSTFAACPKVRQGRAYWSVTPLANHPKRSKGGITIGFESDSEYLSVGARWFAEKLVLPPSCVRHLSDIENARYATLCYLLASNDLALVSVWSPTFLSALLASIESWIESIVDDIREGNVRVPKPLSENVECALPMTPNRRRADELLSAYKNFGLGSDFFQNIWPRLSLVSCWGDANSTGYLGQIRSLLSHAAIQPKGLLATECVVSIPRPIPIGCTLAVRSHFFEFLPSPEHSATQSSTLLAHELTLGGRYRVIVTTGGGLYRYDLGDEIRVVGFEAKCPCVQFVGRAEALSDLVGEKLNERHVTEMMQRSLAELGLHLGFYMLVPFRQNQPVYKLVLTEESPNSPTLRNAICTRLEDRLRTNPQYDLARNLNQLRAVELVYLPMKAVELWKLFEDWESQRGRRVGDIKPSALDYRGQWYELLKTLLPWPNE